MDTAVIRGCFGHFLPIAHVIFVDMAVFVVLVVAADVAVVTYFGRTCPMI
jgi:hypothetical protein